jgi:hypothetical protein
MSIFRRRRDTGSLRSAAAPAAVLFRARPALTVTTTVEPKMPKADGSHDDSDVFVCRREHPQVPADVTTVTLFVFGWHVVEPGPLSWSFPSLRAALDAVKTMRNAAQWCIASGTDWANVEHARSRGAILIEQVT